jgi:hypothetical protein
VEPGGSPGKAPQRLTPTRKARWSVSLASLALRKARLGEEEQRIARPPAAAEALPAERDWTESDFGTLCHERVEKAIAGDAHDFEPSPALARKLELLPGSEQRAVLAEAQDLALRFLASERGVKRRARTGPRRGLARAATRIQARKRAGRSSLSNIPLYTAARETAGRSS